MAQNGNVFEWVESAFVTPNDSPSKTRVRRGGNWADSGPLIRSSSRISADPANSDANVGFRVARVFDAGAGQADMSVEQPTGTAIATGGTKAAAVIVGKSSDLIFTLKNTGLLDLTLSGAPDKVARSGSSDFTVTAQPGSSLIGPGGSTTFTVRFAPAISGAKTATLSIASNDADESPYVINLTGNGLTFTADTDSDGMSDAAELQLAALGFDWQVSQPALVATLNTHANGANLYTLSQVQALNVGVPVLARNAATGAFTLTMGVQKSITLAPGSFTDFPMNGAGTTTVINGAGKLDFQFAVPDNAAFFRVQSQ